MIKKSNLLRLVLLGSLVCILAHAAGGIRQASAQLMSQAELAKLQELYNTANALLRDGDTQKAIQKYTEAIALGRTVPALYINRGLAYISLEKYPEAIADAEKALSLTEGTELSQRTQAAIAYQVKALAVQHQGDNKAAIDLYSKAIELAPSNPKYRNGRGSSYRVLERYQEALADYTEAIRLDPTIPQPLINRAAVYRELKDYDSALKDLDEAFRLDKTSPSLFLNRGNIYFDMGRYDDALANYSQAISLTPKSQYFYSRSRVYLKQGKHELAVKEATEAIALDGANYEAYRARSTGYHRLGQNSLALADIKKAVALSESSVTLRFNFALLLLKSGEFQASVDAATKTIGMDPKWRAPYLVRAAAYTKLGNAAMAKQDQDQAVQLSASYSPEGDDILFFVPDIPGPNDKKQ